MGISCLRPSREARRSPGMNSWWVAKSIDLTDTGILIGQIEIPCPADVKFDRSVAFSRHGTERWDGHYSGSMRIVPVSQTQAPS
jgi:hypothetical protein